MPEQLIWSLSVRAAAGPQLSASGSRGVEAYDKVTVTVPGDGTATDIDLGPGGAAMSCLVIVPAQGDPQLSYSVGGNDIVLDAPVLLLGGAVALAGNPGTLTFKNQTGANVEISILVGRDATP